MKIIYTCLVGSKMHGLSTPNSDEDVRHITMSSLREIVTPFSTPPIKVQDSQGNDIESWELRHFLSYLAKGNPTCYEVIKSPLYVKTEYSERVQSLMPYCFNGSGILMAHCGYADAQIKRYLKPITDGDYTILDEDNRRKRIPKAIVAGYRVIAQGQQLLKTGDFIANIKDYSQELHTKLMDIKTMPNENITFEFCKGHYIELENQVKGLKALYENLDDSVKDRKPDTESIQNILYDMYDI